MGFIASYKDVIALLIMALAGGVIGLLGGMSLEQRYQKEREAERKRKSRAKLKAQKAFVPCGGRELFTK